MATVKAKDFRSLSALELEQKKTELEKMLHELRQKKVIGQLEKPHQFKSTKRQIRQIHTVLREKKNG
jgi:large subunit ribosomal protein L29